MSIKTTHFVTRKFALEAIQHKLEEVSDKQLEGVLEELVASDLHNFSIISEEELEIEKNSEYGCFYIDSLNNLPEPYDQYNQ